MDTRTEITIRSRNLVGRLLFSIAEQYGEDFSSDIAVEVLEAAAYSLASTANASQTCAELARIARLYSEIGALTVINGDAA